MASPKETTGRSVPSLFIVWALLVAAGCAPLGPLISSSTATPRPTAKSDRPSSEAFPGPPRRCVPEFPDRDGWFGGDAAYSIPLSTNAEKRSLWLFGDSFVNTDDPEKGRQYPFIHNSIALARCGSGIPWSIEYYWGHDADGEPRAFFEPDPDSSWVRAATSKNGVRPYYWLFGGFLAHDVLFIGLLRVQQSAASGPFNLSFSLSGMDLARVENYRDPPENWHIQISTLSTNAVAFPGSAFVAKDDFIYAFSFFDDAAGRSPRMLSRVPVEALRVPDPDLSDDLEYYAANAKWLPGFDPANARILMHDNATEMSVNFDQNSRSWLAVYSELGRISGNEESKAAGQIRLRRAYHLEGPWSSPIEIFDPLSAASKSADGRAQPDENLFCYAGKDHPQFSTRDTLMLTYVCSLYPRTPDEALEILRRLARRPDLYRAHSVALPMPPLPEPLSYRE